MLEKFYDQAAEIRATYDQTIDSIKATYKPKRVEGRDQRFADLENKTLAHKRRVATAKAWVEANKKLEAVKAEQASYRTKTRADLEKKLNGLAGTPDLATIRHFHECRKMVAEAAAAEYGPRELAELYETAHLAGDVVLKRAVATEARGHEMAGFGDTPISSRHAELHPEDSTHLHALGQLDQAEHDITTGLREAWAFNISNPFGHGDARTECSVAYGLNTSDPRAVEQLAQMTA